MGLGTSGFFKINISRGIRLSTGMALAGDTYTITSSSTIFKMLYTIFKLCGCYTEFTIQSFLHCLNRKTFSVKIKSISNSVLNKNDSERLCIFLFGSNNFIDKNNVVIITATIE